MTYTRIQGDTGPVGIVGLTGCTGYAGLTALSAPTGSMGIQGDTGLTDIRNTPYGAALDIQDMMEAQPEFAHSVRDVIGGRLVEDITVCTLKALRRSKKEVMDEFVWKMDKAEMLPTLLGLNPWLDRKIGKTMQGKAS